MAVAWYGYIRLYGSMPIRLFGWIATTHGMAVYSYSTVGYMAIWLYGVVWPYMATWLYGYMAIWLWHGMAVHGYYGNMAMAWYGYVAMWL